MPIKEFVKRVVACLEDVLSQPRLPYTKWRAMQWRLKLTCSRYIDVPSLRIKTRSLNTFIRDPPVKMTVNPGYFATLPQVVYGGGMETFMLSECHLGERRFLVSVIRREVSEAFVRSTGSNTMLSAARNALRLMDCGNACSRIDRAFCFV